MISALATVMGSLFLSAYSLALGDPVPRRIDAALVGDPAAEPHTVAAVQRVERGSLAFRGYASVAAALRAIDRQQVYAVLDLDPDAAEALRGERRRRIRGARARADLRRRPEGFVSSTPIRSRDPTRAVSTCLPDARHNDHRLPVGDAGSYERGRPGAAPLERLRPGPGRGGVARAHARRRAVAGQAGPPRAGELGHSRPAVRGRRIVRLTHVRADRPLGDPPDVAVFRGSRQRLVRRRRRAAAAPAAVRLRVAVAAVGRDGDRYA